MLKIIYLFLVASIISCSFKSGEVNSLDSSQGHKRITSDTCSFCIIEPFLIKPTPGDVKTEIVIDYPVAIEFFSQADLVFKYEKDNYDTLMKIFNRTPQEVSSLKYRLTEQHNYYAQGIKPILQKSSVEILDTISNDQLIKLTDKDGMYVIDLRTYKQTDGVLMYTPGKRPIFWTMKGDEDHCFGYFGFPKWYYNCP